DLTCERIECDEIWAFVYSKQKNVPVEKRGEAGDVWTWVALDPDTKLVPTFHIGPRDTGSARAFMCDLAGRLRNRIQLTTDAFSKKVENLTAAVSLHFMHYNFCRVHQTLKTTPAVAAGVTDHVWSLDELIGLLEAAESVPTKRGRYSKTRERRGADSK